jgi:hypothetical protein
MKTVHILNTYYSASSKRIVEVKRAALVNSVMNRIMIHGNLSEVMIRIVSDVLTSIKEVDSIEIFLLSCNIY